MIELRHVSKVYAPNHRALADISFEIETGEVVFIAGPSGAGKSTLLKLLFREEEPTGGEIFIDGQNVTRLNSRGVARLRHRIGLIFQEMKLLAGLTALENVALAAEVIGAGARESRVKAFQLLRDLGLKDQCNAKPAALSVGEQQRVAIARAVINNPALLIADEPTGSLDAKTASESLELLVNLRGHGATLIIASHDFDMINRFGTRIISLAQGVLVDDLRRVNDAERAS